MKSIFNCSLVIGGLLCPVSVYPAIVKSPLSFNSIDKRDNSLLKLLKINSKTGEVIPADQIGRGYNLEGKIIPISDDLYNSCIPPKTNQLVFGHFINAFSLPYSRIDSVYYLLSEQEDLENYSFIYHALDSLDAIGIAQMTFYNCSSLFALHADQSILKLYKLRYDAQMLDIDPVQLIQAEVLNAVILQELQAYIEPVIEAFPDFSTYEDSFDSSFYAKIQSLAA